MTSIELDRIKIREALAKLKILDTESAVEILAFLGRNGRTNVSDISAAMRIRNQKASVLLRKLKTAGFVTKTPEKRYCYYEVNQDAVVMAEHIIKNV